MSEVAGKIVSISGVVQALDVVTGELRALVVPAELFKTDQILTSNGSGVVIQLANGDILTLGPKNEFSLADDGSSPDITLDDSVTEANYPADIEALQQAILDGNFEFLEDTAAGFSVVSSASNAAFVLERAGLLGNIDAGFDTSTQTETIEDATDRGFGAGEMPTEPMTRPLFSPDSSVMDPFEVDRGNSEGDVDSGYSTDTGTSERTPSTEQPARDPLVIVSNLALTGETQVFEGDLAVYTLSLDNPPPTTFTVNVQVQNGTTSNADLDTQSILVTFAPGQRIATFSVQMNDDFIADNGESFSVRVTATSGGGYTSQPDFPPAIQAIIQDDAQPETPYALDDLVEEGFADVIQFTLYALDDNGQRVSANQIVEGESARYVVVATDKAGNDLDLTGTININYLDNLGVGAVSATLKDGSQDYINILQTVSIGSVFTVSSVDDWVADSGESFRLQLVDQSYSDASKYESVSIDTTSVETTIIDDSDQSLQSPAEFDLDTVYLQLNGNAVVDESDGAVVTHFFTLVDKNDDPVNLALGETIQLALSYSDTSGVTAVSVADFQQPLVTNVILTGNGTSHYSFVNTIASDDLNEGNEGYTVSLDSITTNSGYFESLVIDPNLNTATAVIRDNLNLSEDFATVVEGGVVIGQGESLFSNDAELGQNARIISVTYVDENGHSQTADLVGGTIMVDTQYGVLNLNEDGTGTYTSDQTENNPDGVIDHITITVADDNGNSSTSHLAVTVTDTGLSSVDDDLATPRTVLESATAITGNVLTNDNLGADSVKITDFSYNPEGATPNSVYSFGTDDSGQDGARGAYKTVTAEDGVLTVYENGDWSFTPNTSTDNTNDAIVTANFSYTVTDSDGDSDSATQYINILDGANPTITMASIQSSNVDETDLPSGSSPTPVDLTVTGHLAIVSGTDALNTIFDPTIVAPLGLKSNGVDVVYTLSNNHQTLTATAGSVTVFSVDIIDPTNVGNGVGYSFVLSAPIDHDLSANNEDYGLDFGFIVTDSDGDSANSKFTVTVKDDSPTANADRNAINEDITAISGNVIDNSSDDAQDDVIGADQTSTPITGVKVGNDTSTEATGSVGTAAGLAGNYGTLKLNADGGYEYALDNSNLAVQGLTNGEMLIEIYSYTLTDSDGDTSTSTLTITINGQDDGVTLTIPEDTTGTLGDNTDHVVYESGLSDGSAPNSADLTVINSFTLKALDGLDKIRVGGNDFTAAQIQALSTTSQSIDTGEGTLVLNSYNQATDGTVMIGYQYILKDNITHDKATQDDALTDSIAIVVTDTDGDISVANSLDILIKDDSPTANNESSVSVVEGAAEINGNVITNDVQGADTALLNSFTYTKTAANGGGSETLVFDGSNTSYTKQTPTGSLTVNQDGSWSFTPVSSYDQDLDNSLGSFSYTLIDTDGDVSNSENQTITVTDTAPSSSAINGQVKEDDLPAGSDSNKESLVVSKSLGITKAQDDITDVQWSAANIADLQALTLKSNGVGLSYNISGDGYSLIAVAGSDAVFTVALNNPTDSSGTTQSYTFTLQGSLDHADASGNNTITLPFKFDLIDIDSTLAEQAFNVVVVDDVPQGVNEVDVSVVEGSVALTGQVNLLANDSSGADAELTITEFTYTKEDGSTDTVNAGTSVDSQYGTLQVSADGSWIYTSDDSESDAVAVPSETFVYTFKDQDGDVSTASQTINVTDGSDPLIGSPVNQTVNEANLVRGSNPDEPALTQTGSLGVTQGSDAINTTFDTNQPGLVNNSTAVYTSGGTDVIYSVSGDGLTLTAYTTDINSPVFTAVISDPTSNSASYSVTLFKPLDHGVSVVDGNGDIAIPLAFTVTDSDNDAVSSTFNLTIIDDSPSTTQSLSVNEEGVSGAHDTSATINTNADSTQSNTTITTQGTYGFAEINADGTLTYTPSFDGNNAIATNYSGEDTVVYTTTLEDGSTKSTTVTVTINPLTDAPVFDVQPDVTTNEDTLVDLGLVLPVISDGVDQNGSGISGDHAERLGYITLTSVDSGVEIYKADGTTLLFTGANDTMKVAIVDGSGNLDTSIHHTDLDPNAAGVIKLTQAEFVALKLLPAENKHNDIDMTLKATSYEVDDSGNLITSISGAESTSNVHVEVLAVTDTASLSLAQTSYSINEDTTLTLTNDLVEGFIDTDGSEKLWYEVTGLVEGTKVTINGQTYTANASGNIDSSANKITINATDENPSFSIKPPANYSGEMTSITVTLKTQDSDGDSTTTPDIKSQLVTFDLTVNPIAGDVTIATPQAGVEDSPVYLFKQANGNSIFSVTDTNGLATESITNVGILKASIPVGATLSGFASDDADYYYFNVNDLANYTLSPPPHSSADIELTYLVETTDGVDINAATAVKKIVVSAVSETDATDSDGSSANDVLWNTSHNYGTLGQEDQAWLDLNSGFSLFATNEDSVSETTVALISFNVLSANGDLENLYGSQLQYSDGSAVQTLTFAENIPVLSIPAEYLNTLQFSPAVQFSGTVVLDMQIQTQDFDEDTDAAVTPWLSDLHQLTFGVSPVADDVTLAVRQSNGSEDTGRDASGAITNNGTDGIRLYIKPTSDDADGSQTYDLTLSAIPTGASISYNGALIYLESDASGSITITDFDYDKPLYVIAPHNSNEDITLTAQAIAKDGADSTPLSAPLDVLVKINGIADSMVNNELANETATDDNAITHDFNKVITESDFENNGILLNSVFATPANIDSYDDDGSEAISIVISGLNADFTLNNATFMGGTGTDRKWSMTLEEFKATTGNVISIEGAENYSGQVDFNVNFITTENDGNSQTGTPQPVSLLVTPIAEATLSLSTKSKEDTLTKMNFSVVYANEDTGEILTSVWIKLADISNQNFTVYVGNSTNTPLADGLTGIVQEDFSGESYLKLNPSVFENLYIKYDDQVGVDSDSIAIKYQTEDTVTVNGNDYTNTLGPVDANYNLENTAITDSVLQAITSFNGYDSRKTTVSGNDVTLTNNDTLNVNLTMTSIDTDSSENLTKLVIEGVPSGISVQGANYIGNTSTQGGTEFSGTWTIIFDPNDTAFDMDADGVSYSLVFLIDGEPSEGVYNIDITAYNQDGNVSQTIDMDSFNFIVPSAASQTPPDFTNPAIGTPMTIVAFDANSIPLSVTEDNPFTLDSAINADVTGSSNFSITLQNIENCTISGAEAYQLDGKTIYVVTGSGTDIEVALANVTITPNENFNSNDGEPLALEAVLTTYASGGQQNTATFELSKQVVPVTDELILDETLTYYGADNNVSVEPQEDGNYAISIQVDSVDAPHYTLVQGAGDASAVTDITLTHSGVDGVLSWNGGSVTLDSSNSSAIVPSSAISAMTFTPVLDADGTATFNYTIYAQENGATNIQATSESFSFDIQPVVDGLDLNNLAASGLEDSMIEIKADGVSLSGNGLLKDTDGSESIQTLFVNNIPDGFLVFYGANGSTTLAQNTGNNGTPDQNLWNIPITGGNVPQVWLVAPENYAGTLSGLTVQTTVEDGSVSTDLANSFSASWSAVADAISISPTKTFGDEATTIDLNLNAAMQDIDGSEAVIVKLTGNGITLPDGIVFSADMATIGSNYTSGTYTLTGIPYDQLNSIVMTLPQGMKGLFQVNVTAQTIEDSNSATGTVVNSSFSMAITSQVSGVTAFTSTIGDQVNTAISGDTVVNEGYEIALSISDINLVDKDGTENLTIRLAGLTDALTVDVSAFTGVTAEKQVDGSWLVELGNPTDGLYDAKLTALANGDLKLVTTDASGSVESIDISAYSTLIETNDTSDETTPQTVSLNLKVDNLDDIEGTAEVDYLFGNAEANTLNGAAGNDFLDGGVGDDILVGGLGRDTLTGGVGADKFRIAENENSTDIITDFTDGEDQLDLSEITEIPSIDATNFADFIKTSDSDGDLLVQLFQNGDAQSGGTATHSVLLDNQSALTLDYQDVHQD